MQKLNHDRSCAASPFFNSLLGPIAYFQHHRRPMEGSIQAGN